MILRIGAALTAAALIAAPAFAQSDLRGDALAAVAKCASLTDDHARLACYDAAAPKVKDALAAPPAPAQPQVAESQKDQESWFGLPDIFGGSGKPVQSTPQQFGNESLPAPAAQPGQPQPPAPPPIIDSISAAVSDYAIHPDGRFTVFLDNGQVWQQLLGDTDKAKFKTSGNNIVIERGAFGSYNMTLNDAGLAFKVKRVK